MTRRLIVEPPGLINVEQMNFAHPVTFPVPMFEERAAVKPGDVVKVGVEFEPIEIEGSKVSGERFWVRVTVKNLRGLVGEVNNTLYMTDQHGLGGGDKIRFQSFHILDIERPR